MSSSTAGRVFAVALALAASACLDFDKYGEGGGAGGGSTGGAPAGGAPAGGAPQGGAGGSAPTCPSDPEVPATVCVTGGPYDFSGDLSSDWAFTGSGTVGNCGVDMCASIALADSRLDLRTSQIVELGECFASIDVIQSNAQRFFLELVPDGDVGVGPIPEPDLAQNIEVGVAGDTVRFEVAEMGLPALVLDDGVEVDQLRIQVRTGTVVLEAFAQGQQVACSEQPRPASLSTPVRAGFGIQGSATQSARFDNYGALAD